MNTFEGVSEVFILNGLHCAISSSLTLGLYSTSGITFIPLENYPYPPAFRMVIKTKGLLNLIVVSH